MKRKDDFLMQNIGGESLLVPLGSRVVDMNGIVTLNDTGSFIWELLEQDRSFDYLVEAVVGRFDIDRGQADSDIKIFLSEIEQMGLLQ